MARKFFPQVTESVPASPPHPPGTQYRISIGSEDWNGVFVSVVKVQIAYDGAVAGRRSPSYPVDSRDCERVHKLIQKLLASNRHSK